PNWLGSKSRDRFRRKGRKGRSLKSAKLAFLSCHRGSLLDQFGESGQESSVLQPVGQHHGAAVWSRHLQSFGPRTFRTNQRNSFKLVSPIGVMEESNEDVRIGPTSRDRKLVDALDGRDLACLPAEPSLPQQIVRKLLRQRCL